MKKNYLVFLLMFAVGLLSPLSLITSAYAEEIVISGNGADSASAVSSSQQTSVNVAQSNTADTENNVAVVSETGDNSASGNTSGDTAITTGNTSTSVGVENAANTSYANVNACCPAGGPNTITVSGNGEGSNNAVNKSFTTTVNAASNQQATITNTVNGSASTGNNSASNNNGNVSIKTGNIKVNERIINSPVNVARLIIAEGSPEYAIKIAGNGTGSINDITVRNRILVEKTIFNNADIFNRSFWDLITGNNVADDNNGNVLIETGDIDASIKIKNVTNDSYIEDKGCCEEKVTPTPTEKPTPTPTKPGDGKSNGGGGNGGGSGSSNGSSAPAGGNVLPVTGGNWIMLAIFANALMLLSGVLLRMRSSKTSGFRYSFVL